MRSITITTDTSCGSTRVSNRFIDEYMKDANDAQIKIYLYLLRAAGTNLPAGISDIADIFNHTEHDVLRALKYWDKQGVLSLQYDENKKIVGICIVDLDASKAPASKVSAPKAVAASTPVPNVTFVSPFPVVEETPEVPAVPKKKAVSTEQLQSFQQNVETPELLFVTESYLRRPLSREEMESLYFMKEDLHMSTDLIDYLVQFCVGQGIKDFHYMEKCAMDWTERHIATPKEAASYVKKYNKNCYTIMDRLGKKGSPAPVEYDYIQKWLDEYGFSLEIILQACDKSVKNTDSHRLEYADRILENWHKAGVSTLDDAKAESSKAPKSTGKTGSNAFTQYKQNKYDYDALLEQIKVN